MDPETIARNVEFVRGRIAEAAVAQGRSPDSVRLMAVTKTNEWPAVAAALGAGVSLVGENRLQEAQAKFPASFRADWPAASFQFIGRLQKNKVRKVVALFDAIQSIDDPATLELAADAARDLGKTVELYAEVNTSGEDSKGGLRSADELYALVEAGLARPEVRWRGLMTIGPLGGGESALRGAFARLRELSESCRSRLAPPGWGELSMGMSGDYPLAIAEGATMVRVGSALFGPRLYPEAG